MTLEIFNPDALFKSDAPDKQVATGYKKTAWAATPLQGRRTGYMSKDIQFSRQVSKRQKVKKGKLFSENVPKGDLVCESICRQPSSELA